MSKFKENYSAESEYGSIERLLERLHRVKPQYVMLSENVWSPNIDVFLTDKYIVVKIDLAGVDKDKVKIRLKERVLTVEGYRLDQDEGRQLKFLQMEIDYGRFFRQVEIPVEVVGEGAQASYQDGFLHISMPIDLPDDFKITPK